MMPSRNPFAGLDGSKFFEKKFKQRLIYCDFYIFKFNFCRTVRKFFMEEEVRRLPYALVKLLASFCYTD